MQRRHTHTNIVLSSVHASPNLNSHSPAVSNHEKNAVPVNHRSEEAKCRSLRYRKCPCHVRPARCSHQLRAVTTTHRLAGRRHSGAPWLQKMRVGGTEITPKSSSLEITQNPRSPTSRTIFCRDEGGCSSAGWHIDGSSIKCLRVSGLPKGSIQRQQQQ